MPTEITLCIEDDGTMSITTGEQEETPEQEQGEGGNKTPVSSIEEAVAMIKKLAEAAAPSQEPIDGTGDSGGAPGEEEGAMMANYRPGSTGR